MTEPIIDGNKLPRREELRVFGYAPGNYMGNCTVGRHTMYNIAKGASCCLKCAEAQHARYGGNKPMSQFPLTDSSNAQEAAGVAAQDITEYKKGHLTAVKNTSVPMTISNVVVAAREVTAQWFVGATLHTQTFHADVLIGSGTELVFKDGAFIRAQ